MSTIDIPEPDKQDQWMLFYHPKVLFSRRGPAHRKWLKHSKLPKMEPISFTCLVDLLSSKICSLPFTVTSVVRSTNTGEYLYTGDDDTGVSLSMPEEYLFETHQAANREITRIKKMISHWATNDG
jgi:hypothetical protein